MTPSKKERRKMRKIHGLQVCLLFLCLSSLGITTQGQPEGGFKCVTENATCQALVGYVSTNTTTLSHIQSLFQVKSLSSLLGANLLPPSTPKHYTIFPNQTVRIPFPCRCNNGTGVSDRVPIYTVVKDDALYTIATGVFSGQHFLGLITYQQIQAANKIDDANLIQIGQRLWIPLPCSCDAVEGQKVVHFGYVVPSGSTLDQISADFGTTTEVLVDMNDIDPSKIQLGQVIDIPLKGQVLNNLATPSKADADIMTYMASTLTNISGWSGSNFCIWLGVVCNTNGFVTSISLPSKNISGTLPLNLNSLSQLTTFSVQDNRLSGPLPSFANLTLLQEIHLDSNNFTSVPDGTFAGLSHLRILSLQNNHNLSPWAFPAELANSTIGTFNAINSNLMGPIPDIFGSLSALQTLKLSNNNLTGSVPESMKRTRIEYLWLDNQVARFGLSGVLHVLADMTFLKQVWLHDNRFTGPIPDLSNCTNIFDIQLQNNLLTGVVPPSLMSLPGLLNISLQSNKLQGPLPIFPESVTVTLGLGTTNKFCKNVVGECDPQVTTLLEVSGALNYPLRLADAWTGNNACNHWAFVTCDAFGYITQVNLSKQGFGGTISPTFLNLTSLQKLYLNDNNLTGPVPQSLTTLPQLRELNVSNNELTGPVPIFRSSVKVSTFGNKNIGLHSNNTTTTHKRPLGKTATILLTIALLATLIITLLVVVYAYNKRTSKERSQEDTEQWENSLCFASNSPVKFPHKVLKAATNNFDMHRKLGGGGFGSVFEGSLSDGTKIAVKRLDHLGQGKEFLAEVQTIGGLHHVNLVKLVGFCVEKMHRLLVYEHMRNGSLDKWIFNHNNKDILAWDTKKKIILHIAKGLAYLHEECEKRIAHLDIKPQNVLLDDDFNAKLSDFGLAKLIDRDQSFVMTQMRGTRGYLAPEWLGRRITEKVDVYSYGIMILEVVFGRRNLDWSHPEESNVMSHSVKKKDEENQLHDLLDKCSVDMQQNGEDMVKTMRIAVWCLHTEPARRPSMSMVVKVLEGSMIPEGTGNYSLTIPTEEGNPIAELTTLISISCLSGPR